MYRVLASLAIVGLLALGGCSRLGGERAVATNSGGIFGAAANASVATNSNSNGRPAAISNIGGFLSANSMSGLSAKDRAEATSAQYYALQFGRPGAPRSWQGDTGANGKVSVGPYVRVNSLDCRDFSHTVVVGGASHENAGTACREADGNWDVVTQ